MKRGSKGGEVEKKEAVEKGRKCHDVKDDSKKEGGE